jgi:hypothetical protein
MSPGDAIKLPGVIEKSASHFSGLLTYDILQLLITNEKEKHLKPKDH